MNQDPTAVRYWRQGDQVPINIYEGNRPVCQCHSATDAREIVQAVNNKRMGVSQQAHTKTHKDYLDEIAQILHQTAHKGFAYVPDQLAGIVQKLREQREHFKNSCEIKEGRILRLTKELEDLIDAVKSAPIPADYR
jgi:hypothetical protein